uniref:Zinc finger protein 646 n=1 Tax=Laticauda laticaudata TaxID=8630 RepID=A0A8C5WZ34_LATLA
MAEGDAALSSEPPMGQEERPYKCKQCPRSYRHAGSLVNHRRTHEVGLFRCLLCHKDFSNPMSLKSHLRTHTEEKRHKCPDCGRSFRVSSQLPSHHCPAQAIQEQEKDQRDGSYSFQRGHGTSSPAVDSRSGMEGNSGSLLSNLEKYIAESVVPEDGEESGLLAAMEDERRYKCNQCDKAYKHPGSLTNHKQSHTLGVYQCVICYKEFSNLMALRSHARLHSEYRPYKCRFCHKAFRLPSELLSHQKAHSQEESKSTDPSAWEDLEHDVWEEDSIETSAKLDIYQPPPMPQICHQCGLAFPTVASLQIHAVQHGSERERLEGVVEGTEPPVPIQRLYECELCGKSYRHSGSLINHKQTHQTGDFSCSLCSKHFQNVASLKSHLRGHQRPRRGLSETLSQASSPLPDDSEGLPYLCEQCGLGFHQAKNLIDHRQTHQAGIYQCSLCPKEYPTLLALKHHFHGHAKSTASGQDNPMGEGHTEEQPFLCSLCEQLDGRGDPEEEQLFSHICGYCGQTFDDMASLEEHSNGHLEEKAAALADTSIHRPYACGQCGKTYRHGGSLVNHKKIHLIGDYQCSICCRQYRNLSAYRNHLRNHPRCKMNGSIPQLRQLIPAAERGLPCTYERLKDEPCGASQNGEAPPSNSFLACPIGKERVEQGEELSSGLSKSREAQECDVPGEGNETMEAHQAIQEMETTEKEEEGAAEEKGPQAEEEDSLLERPFQCDVCGRSYKHAGSLLNHQKSHKVGHFPCPLCSKAYPNLMSLKNHQRIHYEVKRHQCPDCGKAFKWQRQLQRHQRRPHPCSKIMPGQEIERTRADCERDQGTNPGEAPVGTLQNQPRRKCFRNRASQKNHSCVRAKKRLECSDCGKAYQASRDLMQHLRRHQAEEKGDSPKGKLPEDQLYKCHSCERTYRQPGSLLNHKKAHATGLYHCPSCQRDFYNLLALKNHLHIHMDKRRHRCPHCGKAFRTAKRLATHTKVHGRPEGEETFSCPVCSKRFFHHLTFQQHQLLHTKVDGHRTLEGSITGEGN